MPALSETSIPSGSHRTHAWLMQGSPRALLRIPSISATGVHLPISEKDSMPVKFQLRTMRDARQISEYFNGFHDSFMKKLSFVSQDYLHETGGGAGENESPAIAQTVTSRFDVSIDFAHHNYGRGKHPPDRIIAARFLNARDILIDLRVPPGSFMDWSITELVVHRQRNQPAFRLSIERSMMVRGKTWRRVKVDYFLFDNAEFHEV